MLEAKFREILVFGGIKIDDAFAVFVNFHHFEVVDSALIGIPAFNEPPHGFKKMPELISHLLSKLIREEFDENYIT